jgi:hypothetical protein
LIARLGARWIARLGARLMLAWCSLDCSLGARLIARLGARWIARLGARLMLAWCSLDCTLGCSLDGSVYIAVFTAVAGLCDRRR